MDDKPYEQVENPTSVEIEMVDSNIGEPVEVSIEMQPLLTGEMYDLDERGLGEDIAFSTRKPVAETAEIPKEILAATAAAGTISVTVIVILLVIGLVLGLGIGLGIGAGVGVGVGIGVNACPKSTVQSATYNGAICYDAITPFKDYTVFGTGFFQSVDRDGKILSNPTLKLQQGTGTPIAINQTGIGPALCGKDACLQMNTTGFYSDALSFNSLGYAKSVFSIINKDGCLIETTSDRDIHSVKLGYTGFTPFCISPNSGDSHFTAQVSFTGKGFVWDPSFDIDRPVLQIGGSTYTVTNVTGTCESLSATVRVCDTLQTTLTGDTLPAYQALTATISHTTEKQGCSVSGTINAVSYSTLVSHSSNPICYSAFGDTADITLTGTGFFAGTKAFIQSGGTTIPATFFGFGTSESSIVKFSNSVPAGVWTLGLDNLGCSTTYPGVQLTFLSPVRIFQVSPQAISLGITNSLEIMTSGNTFAPDRVYISRNGIPVKEYIPGTLGSINRLNITIPKDDLTLPGTYTVQVKNTNGCFATLHPGGLNTFVVSTTAITLTSVVPSVVAASETTPIVLTGTGFATNPYVYALVAGTITNPIPLTGIVVAVPTIINLNSIQSQLTNGTYDILIVNRDGSSLLSSNRLTVQANVRPWIRKISPSTFKRASRGGWLDGDNFVSPTMQVICNGVTFNPTVSANTLNRIEFTFDATTVPEASYCTVTVTNAGAIVSWPFHGLSVHDNRIAIGAGATLTNHFSLYRVTPAVKMFNTRRGTKHMLTIGGEGKFGGSSGSAGFPSGTGTPISNSDPNYAVISQWTGTTLTTPTALDELRNPTVSVTGGSLEVIGEYVYLSGGLASAQVWRASILDYQATPTITGHSLSFVNTSGQNFMLSGNWWYSVTATFAAGDAINPGGESLLGSLYNVFIAYPSTPGLNSGFTITLTFDAVPGATGYRVYRTSGQNGDPNSLQFLSTASTPTFTDTGAVVPTTPSFPRYLGKWNPVSSTSVIRGRVASTVVSQTNGKIYQYYLGGGRNGVATVTRYGSLEFLNITVTPKSGLKERESHASGSWITSAFSFISDGGNTAMDSSQMMTITNAENTNLPYGESWLYSGPGENNGDKIILGASRVLDDGRFAAALSSNNVANPVDIGGNLPNGVWGYCFFNWNNGFETWGGMTDAPRTIIEGATYQPTTPTTNPTANAATLTTLTTSLQAGRFRMGCVQDVGYVFLVGGSTSLSSTTIGQEIVMVMH